MAAPRARGNAGTFAEKQEGTLAKPYSGLQDTLLARPRRQRGSLCYSFMISKLSSTSQELASYTVSLKLFWVKFTVETCGVYVCSVFAAYPVGLTSWYWLPDAEPKVTYRIPSGLVTAVASDFCGCPP